MPAQEHFVVGDRVRIRFGDPRYVGTVTKTYYAKDMEDCNSLFCNITWNRPDSNVSAEDLMTGSFAMYLERA